MYSRVFCKIVEIVLTPSVAAIIGFKCTKGAFIRVFSSGGMEMSPPPK